jgi:hypothetical protein
LLLHRERSRKRDLQKMVGENRVKVMISSSSSYRMRGSGEQQEEEPIAEDQPQAEQAQEPAVYSQDQILNPETGECEEQVHDRKSKKLFFYKSVFY